MDTCTICQFEMTLDDTAIESKAGRPICLNCYGRLSDTALPMPRRLRDELEACLDSL
jgi:hypothetical protein